MPQALLLVGAYASTLAAGAAGATALSSGAVLAISTAAGFAAQAAVVAGGLLAFNAVSQALQPGPPDPQTLQFARKDPIPSRVTGFGRARLSGAYMNYATSSDGNSTDVLALHDGQVDGFEIFYLNDDRVTVRGDGWVEALSRQDGRYSTYDKVQILTRAGLPTETAITSVGGSTLPNWGAGFRGDGVAQLALGCRTPLAKYYETIYPNGLPIPSVAARLSRILDPRTGATAWSDNPVLGLLAYLTTASGGMGLDYASAIGPAVASWTAAANDCDLPTETVGQSADLAADAAVGATSITLTSTAGLAPGVAITFGADNTQETVTVSSVSGSTVGVPALTYAHRAGEYASWTSGGGVTAPRYRCGYAYPHDTAPSDVIGTLLASFDGWLGQTAEGALTVYSGRYYAPTVTLGEDAIIGFQIDFGVEAESRVTVYNASYTSPAHDYTTVDAEPWRDEAAAALYGEKPQSLPLPAVQDHGQARRLQKRAMSRQSAAWRGTITTNLAGMLALGERYVQAQLPELGIDTPAEVLKAQVDLSSLTLTFQLIAADPAIDEWSAAEEEGTGPTVTPATSAALLAPPVIAAVSVERPPVNADIQGVGLAVSLAQPLSADQTVTVRWSTDGATWTEVDGLLISGAPAQADVQVEAEISSGDGRYSGWGPAFKVSTDVPNVIPANILTRLNSADAAAAAAMSAAEAAQATADAAASGGDVSALEDRVAQLEQKEQAQ